MNLLVDQVQNEPRREELDEWHRHLIVELCEMIIVEVVNQIPLSNVLWDHGQKKQEDHWESSWTTKNKSDGFLKCLVGCNRSGDDQPPHEQCVFRGIEVHMLVECGSSCFEGSLENGVPAGAGTVIRLNFNCVNWPEVRQDDDVCGWN